ncbi:MAG: hydroxymethylbilane synthase [bacterium]
MKLRLGTRGSLLARTQSGHVAKRLEAHGHVVEPVIIETAGDRDLTSPFGEIGTFGVFVREIERQLEDGTIDVAVHSYKDVPTKGPATLVIAAVPERRDPADVVVARPEAMRSEPLDLVGLVSGARVGTSSARRRAQLSSLRGDLVSVAMRGNVPTRLRKVRDGACDATLLAAAGLERLQESGAGAPDLEGLVIRRLAPDRFVPAPAQGALAVQVRRDRADVVAAVRALDDPRLAAAIRAERALLARVEGGCDLPFGAWAEPVAGSIRLVAGLEVDGVFRFVELRGDDPDALAGSAWAELGADPQAARRGTS